MASAASRIRLPWKKLGLTLLTAGAFAYFWINGPLQEPQPVFEFEEHMTGFAEPVRFGEETQTSRFGITAAREQHAYYHVMTKRPRPVRLYSVIGDRRTNPGLSEEVANLVLADAGGEASEGDGVVLKTALDMYFAEMRDAAGRLYGLFLENTGLNKEVKGYAGPIDIGMTVGLDGRIRSVTHLRSLETTSYLRDIEKAGFYEQFAGMPLNGESYEVDFVTGASLTTEGIARSVSKLVSSARESPLEAYIDTEATGFDVKAVQPGTWVLNTGLIAGLFLLVRFRRVRQSRTLSLGLGLLSILYLGFYLNNSFTYVTYLQPFLGTGWSYLLGAYAALVLAGAIWDGNSYCRHICPYGNVQRLLVRFMPRRGKLPVSNRVLDIVRWGITIALCIGIVSGLRDWGSYELFPDLFGIEILDSPWFWLSLAVVLVSAYFPMLWCRMLCPTGAVLDGVASLARPRRQRSMASPPPLAGIPVVTEPA
ncbi:MAG: 4Fe-4S binding protein [Gammaproteobacteria bacterium]|nr:4Fe-4S binding protein [Gammaproteobacteria bacterium]MDH5275439.1 4Fe-4S binding protein [Gammaproteobacteria bacterium]